VTLPLSTKFNPAALSPDVLSRLHTDAMPVGKKFLLPGQLHVAREATTISTILGSCVAVCLWDLKKRIGGMNHYLLPEGEEVTANPFRYGNMANQELLKQMLNAGCKVQDMQARIFGGAHTIAVGNAGQSLGDRNIELAVEFVRKLGIPLMEKEVSGKRGRKLIFNTQEGSTQTRSFEE
jgi:chemotaxis protein CheD